jgi:hypothetical protein
MKRQQSASSSTSDSPPHKIRRVEPGYLGLTDAQHRGMDRRVLDHPCFHFAASEFPPLLLHLIIDGTHGILDPRYLSLERAAHLIESKPELLTELEEAAGKRAFAQIRLLGE